MTLQVATSAKQAFRDESCNIVKMTKKKVALVPKGYKILQPLQSKEEFDKVDGDNWAVTQTEDSNLLCFDEDRIKADPRLNKFLSRRRDKYFGDNERMQSKHGFLKVVDVDHDWCVEFADKYHIKCGIEIYAEKHWVIYSGTYENPKNIDPERQSTWFPRDDLYQDPIIETTKAELGEVFSAFPTNKPSASDGKAKARKSTKELLDEDWVEGERYSNFRDLSLRRFHEGWTDEQVRNEAYQKNRALTNCHSLDEVDRAVDAGFAIFQRNVKSESNYFKPTEEFLKGDIAGSGDATIDKACELLRRCDKNIAETKLIEWNKEQPEPVVDTVLKGKFTSAVKIIKKESTISVKDDLDSEAIKVYKIGLSLIENKSRSASNNTQVVVKVLINGKPQWIDIQSSTFERVLRSATNNLSNEIYSDSLYQTVIKNIHAEILLSGIEARPVFNRCAFVDGVLYYNLQDNDSRLIRVTKESIDEVEKDESMPIFLKTNRTEASIQPSPKYDNKNALDEFVRICRIQEDDQIIFKSHLIAQFLKGIPIPIDIYHGEQGSAKTSVSSAVKSILDPEGENVMSLPEKEDDIVIMMMSREKIIFDNCDNITKNISQLLCRSVTGTTYGKRELFTTSDEFNVTLKEKIALNGIAPSITQPDLLERSIFYELKRIDKKDRITDDDFKLKIEALKQGVLGCIFTALQQAMIKYDEVKKEMTGASLPRMASFAVWGEAISRALGYENGKFIEKYDEKLDVSTLSLQEDYPMIQPLMDYIKTIDDDVLENGHEETLKIIFDKTIMSLGADCDYRLPVNTKSFGKELKQLAPMIRNLGYEITTSVINERNHKTYQRGAKIVTIRMVA